MALVEAPPKPFLRAADVLDVLKWGNLIFRCLDTYQQRWLVGWAL